MVACGQTLAGGCNGLPGLPAARIRNGHGASNVVPVHFQVQRRASIRRGYSESDVIVSGGSDVDHVFFPLACGSPTDVVATACIRRTFNVHVITAILST